MGTPGHFTTSEVTAADGRPPGSSDARRRGPSGRPAGGHRRAGRGRERRAVRKAVRFIPMALMAFVAVSLFVAAFLIVNTFSMLVSQRQREFGLLRAVGATSRQVFASVVAEAAVVGLRRLGRRVGPRRRRRARSGPALPAPGWRCPTPSPGRGVVAVVSMLGGHRGHGARGRRAGRPCRLMPPVVAILGLSIRTPRVLPRRRRRRCGARVARRRPGHRRGSRPAGPVRPPAPRPRGTRRVRRARDGGASPRAATRRPRSVGRGHGSSASRAGWAATRPPATPRAPS